MKNLYGLTETFGKLFVNTCGYRIRSLLYIFVSGPSTPSFGPSVGSYLNPVTKGPTPILSGVPRWRQSSGFCFLFRFLSSSLSLASILSTRVTSQSGFIPLSRHLLRPLWSGVVSQSWTLFGRTVPRGAVWGLCRCPYCYPMIIVVDWVLLTGNPGQHS